MLGEYFPKRYVELMLAPELSEKPLKTFSLKTLKLFSKQFQHLTLKPNATEGYRTAEVTLGGVDCDALSSKTMEARDVLGLFFIGEVIDVTGWLGGYNFQWAWSSAYAAGQVC